LDYISESEIVINGIYQDTNDPVNFVIEEEKSSLRAGILILAVSCDEGMGFYFAQPTTFKKPKLEIDHVN